MGRMMVTQEMLAAKFGSIFPHLDERQRRLLLGAEARALGHGGIRLVARAADVREATVSLGVAELESGAEPLGRARRPGGGRKRAAEADPGLVPALLALVQPDERGDPMTPLRWTTRSTRDLAGELTRQGHEVSADTVDKLLHEQGFSLQANAKTIEGRRHPDRDGQFRYINEQARAFAAAGDPVISVDAKKKEQVGQYASPGRTWRPAGDPVRVRDHDFPAGDQQKVIPYGIYDLAGNAGWVNVGTDHDTAGFAAESIRRWWNARGRLDYPDAGRLLITADAGGSNGYRTRAWKAGLADLARETGLEITCCHFPPGTSKWNKIEHRLFSAITMNWRGRPLASHEVVVNTIAATTTRTGLTVTAELDPGQYPAGVKISKAEMDALPLARHDWHGDWNYTLHPRPAAPAAPPAPARPPARTPARPGPDLAWLACPAITGLPGPALDALTAALAGPAAALREAALDRRRGYRPRHGHGTGGHPRHTLATKLSAAILHDRHGLPNKAIAALYQTSPENISRHIGDIRRLLTQTGNTIQPAPATLATLDDLYRYAAQHGIIPADIKPAC
jgi:transposase